MVCVWVCGVLCEYCSQCECCLEIQVHINTASCTRPPHVHMSSPHHHHHIPPFQPPPLLLPRSIRSKALVQFVEPFTSLNLAHAASALNTDVPGVQRELETLISKGEVNALIDSHNGVLYARRRDQRAVTFQEAVAAGVGFFRECCEFVGCVVYRG